MGESHAQTDPDEKGLVHRISTSKRWINIDYILNVEISTKFMYIWYFLIFVNCVLHFREV